MIAHAGTSVSAGQPLSEDTPVVGVVYDPCREELFTAVYGLGAWLNGRRISCSRTQTLDDAVLATGFPFRDFSFAGQYMPMLHDAINRARGVRMGAAALDLAWTACGRYDGYWEMGLAPGMWPPARCWCANPAACAQTCTSATPGRSAAGSWRATPPSARPCMK